ncbi:hypothetical protein Taro_033070 [Colocasia esculenta]|uniref:Uncharacterized protein n=1 Tax=Colocasia esculenta TaxID=4460 RepID=A0A843VUB4_COLES|nr:hypothetical protein [Colocasia esculenta]
MIYVLNLQVYTDCVMVVSTHPLMVSTLGESDGDYHTHEDGDEPTYPDVVKKAQLLEDATNLTDRIKGRIVKKEQASSSMSRPTNGKKRPLCITDGLSEERKPKFFTRSAPNKSKCKHCDKPGHTTEEC